MSPSSSQDKPQEKPSQEKASQEKPSEKMVSQSASYEKSQHAQAAAKAEALSVALAEEEKQKLLRLSEISIILDTYDDIFSDFDPRPYDVRSVSDDFIGEVRKAARQKGQKVELVIMMPEALRKPDVETVVRKRVKGHFKLEADTDKMEMRSTRTSGIYFIIVGVFVLSIATYVASIQSAGFLYTFLMFLLEPPGWFSIWTGFDFVFFKSQAKKEELDFSQKMANSDISFISY